MIITRILATFFYTGYFPFIPGTFASFLAVLIFFIFRDNPVAYILLTSLFIVLGFLVSGDAEDAFKKKDPPCIVIDEVAGMLLSLMSLVFFRHNLLFVLVAFLLFRLLDTVKPYPAYTLQKKHGAFGIMMDDLVAAFYVNIILQVVLRLAS